MIGAGSYVEFAVMPAWVPEVILDFSRQAQGVLLGACSGKESVTAWNGWE